MRRPDVVAKNGVIHILGEYPKLAAARCQDAQTRRRAIMMPLIIAHRSSSSGPVREPWRPLGPAISVLVLAR